MEKDLLDISGEDESNWLLKDTPLKGVTSSFAVGGREKSYLDCSPLQIPRSSRALPPPPRPPFSSIGNRFYIVFSHNIASVNLKPYF